METQICKVCGRELPEADFPMNRWGKRAATCKECRTNALRQTKARNRAQMGGGVTRLPFPTPTSTVATRAKCGVRCAAPRSGSRAVAM